MRHGGGSKGGVAPCQPKPKIHGGGLEGGLAFWIDPRSMGGTPKYVGGGSSK